MNPEELKRCLIPQSSRTKSFGPLPQFSRTQATSPATTIIPGSYETESSMDVDLTLDSPRPTNLKDIMNRCANINIEDLASLKQYIDNRYSEQINNLSPEAEEW